MNYRNKANITLAAVCCAFAFATVLKHSFKHIFALDLLYTVVEAALVGGIADWFAVTALFKKPLGFSYHTALIPRNREKVIEAVGHMVEGDLLSAASLKAKITEINVAELMIRWIEKDQDLKQNLVRLGASYIQRNVLKIDPRHISNYFERTIRSNFKEIDLPRLVKGLVQWVLNTHQDDKLVAYVLDELIAAANRPEAQEGIYQFLKSQVDVKTGKGLWKNLFVGLLESTDSLNLTDAATSLHKQLVATLYELKDPAHPIRARFKEILEDTVAKLAVQEQWRQAIEGWREDVFERLPLQTALENLIRALIKAATGQQVQAGEKNPATEDSILMHWSIKQLTAYWEHFKQDPEMLGWIDCYLKDLIYQLIESEHYLIGEAVKRTLSTFTDQDLNQFVEDKAGNDLQWIRINGSIIGGLVGLLMFLFLKLVYDPFIVPALTSWLR